jgi:alcohol dehydrogenase, propanol-preferring
MTSKLKEKMSAMVLLRPGEPLVLQSRDLPKPGKDQIRIIIEACGVCRTDLHIIDGELTHPKLPLVLGHEIVGRVDALGVGVTNFYLGQRVGVPWLGHSCGHCVYCHTARENLCDSPLFTGYTRDGGYATHTIADASYSFPLPENIAPEYLAPLLCAGLIGWRTLKLAGNVQTIGIYGFGAAAHIVAQVALYKAMRVHAFVRPGDKAAVQFALSLGVTSAQDSNQPPPEFLDAALIFAPVGALVPIALAATKKGGSVICGGIHMSEIPAFDYALLWEERKLLSVANLTRQDAEEFLAFAEKYQFDMRITPYPLLKANEAMQDLRAGSVQGAAVLMPQI